MLIKIKDHTYLDFSHIVSVRDHSNGDLEVSLYFEGACEIATSYIHKEDIDTFIVKLNDFWNIPF